MRVVHQMRSGRIISHKRLNFRPLVGWLPPLAVTTVQWLATQHKVTFFQTLMSCFLLWMPWYAYCYWQDHGGPVVPLFSVVGGAHWMSFGSLLFQGDVPSDPIYSIPFTESTVTAVVAMACVGIFALGCGMRVPFRPAKVSSFPDLILRARTWQYLHLVLAACALLAVASDEWVLSLGGLRPVAEIFRSVIPHTIFAILVQKYMNGESTRRDRIVLLAYALLRVVLGVAGGWLGSAVSLGVVACMVFLRIYRRLPVKALLLIVPVVLFLQAGKEAFRQAYWYGGNTGSTMEKVLFWVNQSFDAWSSALSGQSSDRTTGSLVAQSFKRVSLLDQAGNVYDKTPGEVPYQMGKTYSFLLITLIPRAIWPDKPSVNEANRFYQVAYGMTTEEDLDSVSIAVGFLVESFINFGWAGVVFVMFFIGILLGVYERLLLGQESGIVFNAIGMAVLYSLLGVEAQAAQYLGGLLQQIGLTLVVLVPVMSFRRGTHPDVGGALAT